VLFIHFSICRNPDAERGSKTPGGSLTSNKMSDTQLQLAGSGSRQIEQESTEETTLSEVGREPFDNLLQRDNLLHIPSPY
jgi:hypothetical protein